MCSDALRTWCAGQASAGALSETGCHAAKMRLWQVLRVLSNPLNRCLRAGGNHSAPPRQDTPCQALSQGASWTTHAWCAGRAWRSPGQWGSTPGTGWQWSAWWLLGFGGWTVRMMHLHPPRIGGNLHKNVTFRRISHPQVWPETMWGCERAVSEPHRHPSIAPKLPTHV